MGRLSRPASPVTERSVRPPVPAFRESSGPWAGRRYGRGVQGARPALAAPDPSICRDTGYFTRCAGRPAPTYAVAAPVRRAGTRVSCRLVLIRGTGSQPLVEGRTGVAKTEMMTTILAAMPSSYGFEMPSVVLEWGNRSAHIAPSRYTRRLPSDRGLSPTAARRTCHRG